jgi:hypothetical protein
VAELGHQLVRPVVFPRWPENALLALTFSAAVIVIVIASKASVQFGGEFVAMTLVGGAPAVVSFMLMAFFVRHQRL